MAQTHLVFPVNTKQPVSATMASNNDQFTRENFQRVAGQPAPLQFFMPRRNLIAYAAKPAANVSALFARFIM